MLEFFNLFKRNGRNKFKKNNTSFCNYSYFLLIPFFWYITFFLLLFCKEKSNLKIEDILLNIDFY